VQLQDVAHDVQAEARAAVPLELPLAHLAERLRAVQHLELCLAQPRARVLDTELDRPAVWMWLGARTHAHLTVALGELDRVGHAVVQTLLQPAHIADAHGGRYGGRDWLEHKLHALGACEPHESVHCRLDEAAEPEGLLDEHQSA